MGAFEFLSHLQGLHIVMDLTLLSIFSGFFIVPMYALIQERSEISQRSRIIAGNNIINALFMVCSAGLLVGLLKWGFTIPDIFLMLAGAHSLLSVGICLMIPDSLVQFLGSLGRLLLGQRDRRRRGW